MAVNRYQNHLVIYLEDQPYRGIVNGVKSLPNINDHVIDVKSPCGGWVKVFAELEGNLNLLNNKVHMHALLLMDFDNDFSSRIEKFNRMLSDQVCEDRVFLLGVDKKESEDLKTALNERNNEAIGGLLLRRCPDETVDEWQNPHLHCNKDELERMREAGVFDWLFK